MVNRLDNRYILYAFRSLEGFSKVGSFAVEKVPFKIVCGFKPKMIIFKSMAHRDWLICDAARGNDIVLWPNWAGAEHKGISRVNFLDEGFEMITPLTSPQLTNPNFPGEKILYLAFNGDKS